MERGCALGETHVPRMGPGSTVEVPHAARWTALVSRGAGDAVLGLVPGVGKGAQRGVVVARTSSLDG